MHPVDSRTNQTDAAKDFYWWITRQNDLVQHSKIFFKQKINFKQKKKNCLWDNR